MDQWRHIRFSGKGGEFFRIWIVNLVLTLLTLGIYSAWATVRTRRYFYGNTEIAGSRLDFHGKPLQILIGRIIAVALLIAWTQGALLSPIIPIVAIAVIVLLFPWFLVRAFAFRLRHTSLRNLRFGFDASARQAYKSFWPYIVILGVLLAGMTFFANQMTEFADAQQESGQQVELGSCSIDGMTESNDESTPEQQPGIQDVMPVQAFIAYFVLLLLLVCIYPVFVCDVRRFTANHSQYGQSSFRVNLRRIRFVGHLWLAVLVGLVAMLISLIPGGILMAVYSFLSSDDINGSLPIIAIILMVIMYVLMIAAYAAGFACWKARIFNDTFNSLTIDTIGFRSRLSFLAYAWLLVTNTLLMIVSVGLAYPWARVRQIRYQLQSIDYQGDTEGFVTHTQQQTDAVGDEIGEAFDVDFGF